MINSFNLTVSIIPTGDCLAYLSMYSGGTYQLIQEESTEFYPMDFFRIPYGRYKLVLRKERFRTCTVFFTVAENYISYEPPHENIKFKRGDNGFVRLNVELVRE